MNSILIASLIFILGLVAGSFFNVCIYRLPRGLSVISPSSFCPVCKRALSPAELVPVLSFLLQRGRCRHCGARMSLVYPVIELLTAALFTIIYLKYALTLKALSLMVLASFLIIVSTIDFFIMEIPDSVTVAGTISGLLFSTLLGRIHTSILGAAMGFSLIFVLIKIAKLIYRKDAIGDGDAMLLMMTGSFLGIGGVLATLYMGFMVGGIFAMVLVILRQKKGEDEIPLGPFIALGALGYVLFGADILGRYLAMAGI